MTLMNHCGETEAHQIFVFFVGRRFNYLHIFNWWKMRFQSNLEFDAWLDDIISYAVFSIIPQISFDVAFLVS